MRVAKPGLVAWVLGDGPELFHPRGGLVFVENGQGGLKGVLFGYREYGEFPCQFGVTLLREGLIWYCKWFLLV